MPNEDMPLWMQGFQNEVLRRFSSLESGIKDVVSKDTFRDAIANLERENVRIEAKADENRHRIEVESALRAEASLALAMAAKSEQEARERTTAQTRMQWYILLAGPFVGGIAVVLFQGMPK